MDQNFVENELIILSKQTLDLFLKQENCADLIAVYTFYYYTAKWQKTNQPKCSDTYVMKGLGIGKKKLSAAKAFLESSNLITPVQKRDKIGKVTGWYTKLNYIWANETVSKEIQPEVSKATSGCGDTNALSASSLNALNANNITTSSESNDLPDNRGKSYILRVISIYKDLFRQKYGFDPQIAIPRLAKPIKDLAGRYSEFQIAALLIIFFNWSGMTGGDQFEADKLTKAANPFGWFYSSVTQYEVYIRNIQNLQFDDPSAVRKFVVDYMINLKKPTT